MMNPITRARNYSLMSTTRLAKELGVSKQYVSRIEQGIYDQPNKRILEWAAEELAKNLDNQVTSADVLSAYTAWQWKKRVSVKEEKALRPVEINEYYNPSVIYYHKVFRDWRGLYWNTPHAFAVDMCIHPDSVANYESGKLYKMPTIMKEILGKLGLLGKGFKTGER